MGKKVYTIYVLIFKVNITFEFKLVINLQMSIIILIRRDIPNEKKTFVLRIFVFQQRFTGTSPKNILKQRLRE